MSNPKQIKENKTLPTFRGRFGTRSKRKKSIAKWDKWRHPRGIDINWKRGDGKRPKIGYSTPNDSKGLHPKLKVIKYLNNVSDIKILGKDAKDFVYYIAAKVGKKKRIDILESAKKIGIDILNK
jgi:large subunit ribosomal protein L32e